MLRDLSVGEHQTPHDLGEEHLLPDVVASLEHRCEGKVIDRLRTLRLAQRDELAAGVWGEGEVPLEDTLEVSALWLGELAIGVRDVEQQGASGDMKRIRVVRLVRLCGLSCRRPVDEFSDGVEKHGDDR